MGDAPQGQFIGLLVIGLLVILTLVNTVVSLIVGIKSATAKSANLPQETEFVQRKEFEATIRDLERKIDLAQEHLRQDIVKISDYQHKVAHDSANAINALALQVNTLVTLAKIARKEPHEPAAA